MQNKDNPKRYSFEPIDFEHIESEMFLEVLVFDNQTPSKQLVEQALKIIYPRMSDNIEFELESVEKDDFYNAYGDFDESLKWKIRNITILEGITERQEFHLIRHGNGNNIALTGIIHADSKTMVIEFYSTA